MPTPNDPGSIANLSLDYTQQWTGGIVEVAGVTTDGLGNVYTIGAFQGAVDFDPSANGRDLTSIATTSSTADMFIRKQDNNGNLLWVKQFSSNLSRSPGFFSIPVVRDNADISVDRLGNVYAIGSFGLAKWDSSGNSLWAKPLSRVGVSDANDPRQIQVDGASNVYAITATGLTKYTSNGELVWNNATGFNLDVDVDAAGNVYSVGVFSSNVDFDPGSGVVNLNGATGATYIRQLKSNGDLGWVKQLNIQSKTGPYRLPHAMVVGNSGVYLSGFFRGTSDFDPGAGVANLQALNLNFSDDTFVSKLDLAGNFVWAKRFSPQSPDNTQNELAIDATGNVYITGGFSGTVDFDPGSGVSNLNNSINQFPTLNTFISKLDTNGNFVWAKQFAGDSNIAMAIGVDRQGNAFTVGNFILGADFDPGAGTKALSAGRYSDGFLSKLDSAGNFVFAQSYAGERFTNTVALDDRGNAYVAGSFAGTVDFDPGIAREERSSTGSNDAFISKLDAVGNHLWTRTLGGVARDGIENVTADGSGNVYVLGGFIGAVDFDPGVGVTNLTGGSGGVGSPFLIKFDAIGNFVWVKPIVLPTVGAVVDLRSTADGTLELFHSQRYLKFDRDGNLLQQEDRLTVAADYQVFDREGNSYTYTAGAFGSPGTPSNLTKRSRNGTLVWTESVAEQYDPRPTINADGDIAVIQYGFLGQTLRKYRQPERTAEIFWRNSQSNNLVTWNLANGTQLVDGRLLTYGQDIGDNRVGRPVAYDQTWRLAGNADLNGDGIRDLTYTRDGAIRVLTVGQVNNKTATVEADREFTFASTKFGSLNGQAARPLTGWELVGVADMTGDRQADFVFYSRGLDRTVFWTTNQLGQIVDGGFVTSELRPGGQETGAPNAWNVQALADFNGDGQIDILWRNTAGVVVLWAMNGTKLDVAKSGLLPNVPTNFQVKGIGDFNHDGIQDLIWRDQTTGVNRVWAFGVNGRPTEVSLLAAPTQWEIGAIADVNSDGFDDIIWRNNQENNVVIWALKEGQLSLPNSGYVLNYLPGGDRQVIKPGGLAWKIEPLTGLAIG
jgi:FG-GAP-like repeat